MANSQLIALAKESRYEDVPELLRALRERHPHSLTQAWLESLTNAAAVGEGLDLLDAEEFLRRVGNPPPMAIEGLLPDRSLFLLSGKPKAGKSFLALDMAEGVRTGGLLWGKYRVNRPGPVVYLGMEDGEFEIANRLLTRGRAQPDAALPHKLHVCAQRFALSDPERMARLQAGLQEINPSLLIVDTAAEGLGIRDWLNRSEIIEKVGPIRELARRVCSVLLVSHNRKADGELGDEIAGSNAFTGAVDGWLSAYKVEALSNGNRRLWVRTEGRGGVRGEFCVEMDTRSLRFHLLSPEQAQEQAKPKVDETTLRCVRQAIEGYGGKATIKQIADWNEWPMTTTFRRVQALLECRAVREMDGRVTGEAGGKPALCYGLCDV